jgi:hypothetical protein
MAGPPVVAQDPNMGARLAQPDRRAGACRDLRKESAPLSFTPTYTDANAVIG